MKTVSDEDRHKIFELCKNYLKGEWSRISENDIRIDLIDDGFISKLFICCLPVNVKDEYGQVVIRYDGQGCGDLYSSTHVLAMNLILSEKNISPKLLGVFSDGTISQFIENRYFNADDDRNPKRAGQLARKLANFHALKMPIPKTCSFWLNNENYTYILLFERVGKSYKEGKVRKEIIEHNYETLLNTNFIDEMQWMNKLIESFDYPIVFSHNDFNKKNILVKETEGSEEIQIFLIDFDWSSYSYRGVDFGQYFSSWGQTEPDFGSGDFPTDEEMSVFIDSYIEEMCKIMGDSYAEQEINSRERLIKEAKIFSLMAFIKDIFHTIWQTDMDNNILDKGERRYKCYKSLKNKIELDCHSMLDINNI